MLSLGKHVFVRDPEVQVVQLDHDLVVTGLRAEDLIWSPEVVVVGLDLY